MLGLLAFGCATALGGSAEATPSGSLPQPAAAVAGATWLDGQFTGPFIPSTPGVANLSATANAILALAAARVDLAQALDALAYLATNLTSYITVDGANGPGPLSLLILDTEALGQDPTTFGGVNLVADLKATEQPSGPDTGLFGTEAQVATFDAGTYDQALALAALKSAGVTASSAAKSWLINQQCGDGGWVNPDVANGSCTEDPANFAGPDSNTTALAVQGLMAQGAMTSSVSVKAQSFLLGAQNPDGGWGYQSTNPSDPQFDRTGDPGPFGTR